MEMTFDRGRSSITLAPNPERGCWTFTMDNPEYVPVEDDPDGIVSVLARDMNRSLFGPPKQPRVHVQHATAEGVLCALTPEECRLLLGFCCHVCEHSVTHLTELAMALTEAIDARNTAAIRVLLAELSEVLALNELADAMGRLLVDVEVVT